MLGSDVPALSCVCPVPVTWLLGVLGWSTAVCWLAAVVSWSGALPSLREGE